MTTGVLERETASATKPDYEEPKCPHIIRLSQTPGMPSRTYRCTLAIPAHLPATSHEYRRTYDGWAGPSAENWTLTQAEMVIRWTS